MIAVNRGDKEEQLETKRMKERLNGFFNGKDHVTDETISNLAKIVLPANSIRIIELGK
jgi:hypothetical protein